MNTSNNQSANNNTDTLLESLRYDSLFSSQKFEIDSKNNLHITELSTLKQRNEVVPLDLINPQPTSKKRLNKPLMLLALASTLVSGGFFASAIFMGELWTVAFAIVFWAFGMGTLIASFKNQTTVYHYKFLNTETLLFSLPESSIQNHQAKLFVNALSTRITSLNAKNEQNETSDSPIFHEENITPLEIAIGTSDEMGLYLEGKKSQYTKHLNFLFNHGIVDEVLYEKLNNKINKRVSDSENRFMTDENDIFVNQTVPNNIINFPINA